MAESVQTSFAPSANIATLEPSATIAVSARAKALRAEGIPVIDLGAGEPDFDTPPYIRRAAQRALDEGATRYTTTEGIAPLRQAIAEDASAPLVQRGARAIAPDEVVVSTGSKQALMNSCFALFGPGDEVLIPTPGWTSYYEIVRLARATPVAVPGDPDDELRINVAALERAATEDTRGLILNSPCNPTGAMYTAEALREIHEFAASRGWWLISDEIYRRITYDVPAAPSALDVADWPGQLVVINGVAKAYAMTGWRIGWAIAPRPLSRAMAALQSHTTSNAAAVSQHAALAALSQRAESDLAIEHMVQAFRSRRNAALAILREEPRLRVIEPQGAFYLFINVAGVPTEHESAGSTFARHLLDEAHVAVVPGAAFRTPEWVRVSYAAEERVVCDGVRRLVDTYRRLAG